MKTAKQEAISKHFIKLKNGKYRFKGNFERNNKSDLTLKEAIDFVSNLYT